SAYAPVLSALASQLTVASAPEALAAIVVGGFSDAAASEPGVAGAEAEKRPRVTPESRTATAARDATEPAATSSLLTPDRFLSLLLPGTSISSHVQGVGGPRGGGGRGRLPHLAVPGVGHRAGHYVLASSSSPSCRTGRACRCSRCCRTEPRAP